MIFSFPLTIEWAEGELEFLKQHTQDQHIQWRDGEAVRVPKTFAEV